MRNDCHIRDTNVNATAVPQKYNQTLAFLEYVLIKWLTIHANVTTDLWVRSVNQTLAVLKYVLIKLLTIHAPVMTAMPVGTVKRSLTVSQQIVSTETVIISELCKYVYVTPATVGTPVTKPCGVTLCTTFSLIPYTEYPIPP